MKRPAISPERFHELRALVPAPAGHSWQWDPAASGDRLRLFRDEKGRDIVVAYAAGDWGVNSPDPGVYLYAATGKEPDIEEAMRRGLATAHAIGWALGEPESVVLGVVRPSGTRGWIKATKDVGGNFTAVCRDHEHGTELEAEVCEKTP